MPTPVFVCGAECGLVGTGTASGGVEHWATIAGTPAISTTTITPAGSERSFRFNPSASTSSLQHTFASLIASPATEVARFYVRFASLPTADTRIFFASVGGVVFESSDSTLRACGATAANQAASGAVVTTGVWYRVDVKIVRDSTVTVDIRVNGSAQAQYSVAGAASTLGGFTVGIIDSCSADMFVDDICVSGTSGDYPLGPGTVIGLYPNADGTHATNNSGDFGKGSGAGTGVNQSDTDTWQSLENPLDLTVGTNFLGDIGALTDLTEYLELQFENLPSWVDTVNAVTLVATTHSASTTANNLTLRIYDGSTQTTVINADHSETGIVSTVVTRTTNASGSAWTPSLVNAERVRFTSSDNNPDVYLDGICLEVDVHLLQTRTLSSASLTLTPVALGRTATVSQALSAATVTLAAVALALGGEAQNVALSPASMSLSPVALGRTTTVNLALSASTVSLTAIALARTASASLALSPASTTLTPVSLGRTATASVALSPATMPLSPVALTRTASVSIAVTPATLTLTAVSLGRTATVSVALSPATSVLSAVELAIALVVEADPTRFAFFREQALAEFREQTRAFHRENTQAGWQEHVTASGRDQTAESYQEN